jgi:aspartokinase/homoserine dehydrogenase 1
VPEVDAAMHERFDAARSRGKVLRYVGRLDADSRRATVGLVEVDRSHFLANMSLTDNVVSFTTSRYNRNPLVVRAGAGPRSRPASSPISLRVCAYLGARL